MSDIKFVTNYPKGGLPGLRGGFGISGSSLHLSNGEARNLKFGVWMGYVTYWPTNDKSHQRERGLGYVTNFKFWDPLPICGTAESMNLKFGIWLNYARTTNYPKAMLGRGQGMILVTSGNRSRWASITVSSYVCNSSSEQHENKFQKPQILA